MNTESLIRILASGAAPVRPLLHPVKRYLCWLVPALAFMAAASAGIGWRRDIVEAITNPVFVLQASVLLLLALTAAASAFHLGAPGKQAGPLWLALALTGCLLTFVTPVLLEAHSHAGAGLRCLRNILLLSLPPAAALYLMLWRGFPLAGSAAGLLAFLASFALGCLGTRFICPHEEALHFLVWHCIPVLALTGAGALTGHFFLRKTP